MQDQLAKALIFDFDGTLVDSLHVTLSILNQLTHRQILPADDISRLRGMTLRQMLQYMGISPIRAVLLRRRVYAAMSSRLNELVLVPGIAAMLRALSKEYALYIVSSNDGQNVLRALDQFQLGGYISGVEGNANQLSKAWALRRLMRAHSIQSSWYIGDQAVDVRSGRRVGLRTVAVSWGFSNVHVLNASQPDLLVFTPEELTQHFLPGESHGE